MKHARALSKNPNRAISLVEADGLLQFVARVLAVLTASLDFWNLLALPSNEIDNEGKGI